MLLRATLCLAFIHLIVSASLGSAADGPDPVLLGNEIGLDDFLNNTKRELTIGFGVRYDLGKLSNIRDFAVANKLAFADVEPVDATHRLAVIRGVAASKRQVPRDKKALHQKLLDSHLFVEVTIPEGYTPGYFYVYVKPGLEAEAEKTLGSLGIRPERWEVGAAPLFQCAVEPGQERFWMRRVRKYSFAQSVLLDTGIHWSAVLWIPEDLPKSGLPKFEELLRTHSLFVDKNGVYTDKSAGYYGFSMLRVPTGQEVHFIRLFREQNISLTHAGLLDGDEVLEVSLKNQDTVALESLTRVPMPQGQVVEGIVELLKTRFPTATITPSGKTGVKLTSEHRGFKVLNNRRSRGWEKCQISVVAASRPEESWEVRVTTRTWATGKGSETSPPQDDHYKRITDPGATPSDLKAEQRFTEKLAADIVSALKKKGTALTN